MFQGGSLIPDKTFKKILSIGYEFETHDLAKLSLHSNKKSLINSQMSLRVLEGKLDTGSATEMDDNYISVRIPIHKDDKPHKEKLAETETKNDIPVDYEELEFMAAFEDEYEEEMNEEKQRLLEERENESYLEYFTENRKTDNKKTVKFHVTNDIGDIDFGAILKKQCEDVNIAKNDMYFFKTNTGKLYDFKFSEELTDSCPTFTGVEYIVTYYSPKKENANIIVDTFVDACSRIVDHLINLKKTTGELLMHDENKTHYIPVGELGKERCLYHKPDTNLFYMDTYDTENMSKTQNIGDAVFVPQMTFRCKALDLIEIIKEILEIPDFKKSKTDTYSHDLDLEDAVYLEETVDKLIDNFNKTAKLGSDRKRKTIDKTTIMAKNLKTYMFLIYYKLYYYIQEHKLILNKEEEDYLKDHLSFASRHNNTTLYNRIKEILQESFDISEIDEVHRLLCQPSILSSMYKFENKEKTDHNYEGSAKAILQKSDPHYGDPLYSLSSYFKHFEDPKTITSQLDWLTEAKIDSFSTTFPLVSDHILVENRFFRFEIGVWLRNTVDKNFSKDTLKLKEMLDIVNKLYGPNIKKMINLVHNPIKNKLTRKCKPGYYRNIDFKCVKMKLRKSVKKTKTKQASKSKKSNAVLTSNIEKPHSKSQSQKASKSKSAQLS
jgi:hypothetical protein